MSSLMGRRRYPELARTFSRIENPYFVNGRLFGREARLLDEIEAIRQAPAVPYSNPRWSSV